MSIWPFKKPHDPAKAAPAAADMPAARTGHYLFAHRTLREVALDDPTLVMGVLAGSRANEFLNRLIDHARPACREKGEEIGFDAADLEVSAGRVGNFPCALVRMPQAVGVAEAHFVAMVLLADMRKKDGPLGQAKLRYFTLEASFPIDGKPSAAFCEWTHDAHLNLGFVETPTMDAFVKLVTGAVTK